MAFFNARGRPVAIDTVQPSLDVHLFAQCDHFGIPSPKIASEVCDHAEAFCKLAVEVCGFICRIAAGSGVGFSLRAIGVGSAVGVAVQALSTGKLSAHININASVEVRQSIGVVDHVLDMLAFLDRVFGFRLCV